MKKTINFRPYAADYSEFEYSQASIDTVLEHIFLSRGAHYADHHDYGLDKMLHPESLFGIEDALSLLVEALEKKHKILIVGDFDADGATSTALAMRCLRAFGAAQVDYLVPNRFVFGYGLTPEIVQVAGQLNPHLIITVDNGISSVEGVALAKKKDIKVLVTDHHLPGAHLPVADAIVNPNQGGCSFPSKNLAGVGVCFYIMSALRRRLRELGWFVQNRLKEPNMAAFLDIVALGTVADVVPLDYNNRILVAAGLKRMRGGQACAGIQALLRIAGREPQRLTASDLGFILGPRLNAAGRLDDMSLGIQCLLSNSFREAQDYAKALDDLNRDRKSIESSMHREALEILEELSQEKLHAHRNGLCLFREEWHQGVIGILASRIKDRLHRPTIVFAKTDEGQLKGSGRSIPGVHLRDVLDEIATHNPGLLKKFGGHAMAAGMSLEVDKFAEFDKAFDTALANHLTDELKEPGLSCDGTLPEPLMHLDMAQAIEQAGPWGQAFPEPVFEGIFHIVSQRIVGEKHLKLLLNREMYSHVVFDAIAFNVNREQWPDPKARRLRLLYHLNINEYRGQRNLQLLAIYLKKLE